MSDKPKRRWFQFSLKTQLVSLTVVALGLGALKNGSLLMLSAVFGLTLVAFAYSVVAGCRSEGCLRFRLFSIAGVLCLGTAYTLSIPFGWYIGKSFYGTLVWAANQGEWFSFFVPAYVGILYLTATWIVAAAVNFGLTILFPLLGLQRKLSP